jgi:hypothetical protein
VCVLGLSQLVVLTAARRPPRPTQFGDFPRKDALDARLPPPASRHAQSGNRSHDLSVARPTLSPVELAGDPCLRARMCVGREACYGGHVPIKVLNADAKGTGHDCEGDTRRQLKQITRLTTYMTGLLKRGRGILRRTPDYYGLLWRARSSRVLWQGCWFSWGSSMDALQSLSSAPHVAAHVMGGTSMGRRGSAQMEDAGHAASANRRSCAALRLCKRDNRLFSLVHKATPRHMDTLHRPLIVRCTHVLQPKGGTGFWACGMHHGNAAPG